MNRRSFLRAAGATGLLLAMQGLAAGSIFGFQRDHGKRIRQALAERRVVQFKYHGHVRIAEPHALGQVTAGRPALLGWQVSGGSVSEPPPGWRTFILAEISSLRLLRETFIPRPDYNAATSALKAIEAEAVPKR